MPNTVIEQITVDGVTYDLPSGGGEVIDQTARDAAAAAQWSADLASNSASAAQALAASAGSTATSALNKVNSITTVWLHMNIPALSPGADYWRRTQAFDDGNLFPSGYKALGIVGYNLDGSYSTYCSFNHMQMSGNTNLYYGMRNNGSYTTSTLNLSVQILVIRE